MDTFDLRWPHGTATLCTDGWRCRIVWRGARGLGGSIENSELAKTRVADGLVFAPKLLEQLRQRGHGELAEEIELLMPGEQPSKPVEVRVVADSAVTARVEPAKPVEPSASRTAGRRNRPGNAFAYRTGESVHQKSAAPPTAPADPPPASDVRSVEAHAPSWLDALEGDDSWQPSGNRRAKTWHEVTAGIAVKTPAAKAPREWVVKSSAGKKAEYATAASFKGVLRYVEHKAVDLDDFLAHSTVLAQADAEANQAVASWRQANPPH